MCEFENDIRGFEIDVCEFEIAVRGNENDVCGFENEDRNQQIDALAKIIYARQNFFCNIMKRPSV